MSDWSLTALNMKDLNPNNRMKRLYSFAEVMHVDDHVAVKKYCGIAHELFDQAKTYQTEDMHESALFSFLRFQALVKNLKHHVDYRNIPFKIRASFDYNGRKATENIKKLKKLVRQEYVRFFKMIDFGNINQDFAGYQEQRPTLSTIRTFISETIVSEPRPTITRAKASSRVRYRPISNLASVLSLPTSTHSQEPSVEEKSQWFSIRRTVFASRQVEEFGELHKQRKIVRSLRTLVLPSKITTAFSYLSRINTKRNVETVGYLAGIEADENELVVTHLIIPKQMGFSDYFKVFDSTIFIKYLDRNNLLTLGWIHSHPIEKPYLSSVDLHYHCVFQNVLAEAVAMVFSPKEMRSETFNLTPNHGIEVVFKCTKKGFHTHPTNPPLSMVSQHAVIDLTADLTVKDFRTLSTSFSDDDLSPSSPTVFERMLNGESDRSSSESTIKRSNSRRGQSEVTFFHLEQVNDSI